MSSIPLYILNHLPWLWFGLFIFFIVIEALTLALTTIWFACGAFALIFISLLPIPLSWQVLLFLLISCSLLFYTRPVALHHFNLKRPALNSDALIGKKVVVTESITSLKKGAIKVNGIVWTATSVDGSEIAVGTECTVTDIQGVTAIVKKA
ncbi:MAG: NfeD family protein [Treponema sp.]|nr:NfeD family protein [Treponema sp.]